ncbi:putative purine transporter [Tripterygium wilfordii]|uniref:Putative purine transporter n=1 Tax=Tripterygium wilfordii TaxID=458696 RepID=A0A7J7CCS0_TRIWF|nr:putative purine transporter [Tripterygium wilfordii]
METATINNQKIPREAKVFQLGEASYYGVIIGCALLWQCFFMGAVGVISCASSLLSGVLIAALLPVTEILAVLIFSEKFQVEKGIALALSVWGFISYFYGEVEEKKKKNRSPE